MYSVLGAPDCTTTYHLTIVTYVQIRFPSLGTSNLVSQIRCIQNSHIPPDIQNLHILPDILNLNIRPHIRNLHIRPHIRNLHIRPHIQNLYIRPDIRNLHTRPNIKNLLIRPDIRNLHICIYAYIAISAVNSYGPGPYEFT